MAVFTEVSEEEAQGLLRRLGLGELQSLRGIAGGIENTNYFVTCESGEFVLTLFERLDFDHLPFYLHLMKHLAHHGVPVPDPQPDAKGEILHTLCGKPAAVVNRLPGASELAPDAAHCAGVGEVLAREINPITMTAEEFRKRRASDSFVQDVLGKEKLFVKGTADELERLG